MASWLLTPELLKFSHSGKQNGKLGAGRERYGTLSRIIQRAGGKTSQIASLFWLQSWNNGARLVGVSDYCCGYQIFQLRNRDDFETY